MTAELVPRRDRPMALTRCPCPRALLAASPANGRTPGRRFGPGRRVLGLGEWHAQDAMPPRGARLAQSADCGGAMRAFPAAMCACTRLKRRWARTGAVHPRCAPRPSPCRCRDSSCGLPLSCLSSRFLQGPPAQCTQLTKNCTYLQYLVSVSGCLTLNAGGQACGRAGAPMRSQAAGSGLGRRSPHRARNSVTRFSSRRGTAWRRRAMSPRWFGLE